MSTVIGLPFGYFFYLMESIYAKDAQVALNAYLLARKRVRRPVNALEATLFHQFSCELSLDKRVGIATSMVAYGIPESLASTLYDYETRWPQFSPAIILNLLEYKKKKGFLSRSPFDEKLVLTYMQKMAPKKSKRKPSTQESKMKDVEDARVQAYIKIKREELQGTNYPKDKIAQACRLRIEKNLKSFAQACSKLGFPLPKS